MLCTPDCFHSDTWVIPWEVNKNVKIIQEMKTFLDLFFYLDPHQKCTGSILGWDPSSTSLVEICSVAFVWTCWQTSEQTRVKSALWRRKSENCQWKTNLLSLVCQNGHLVSGPVLQTAARSTQVLSLWIIYNPYNSNTSPGQLLVQVQEWIHSERLDVSLTWSLPRWCRCNQL